MHFKIKHFTILFLLLLVLSTGTVIAIFKVESDTSSAQFIEDEKNMIRQELLLSTCSESISKQQFDAISSFHPKALCYITDKSGHELIHCAVAPKLTSLLPASEIKKLLHNNQLFVKELSGFTIIGGKFKNSDNYKIMLYDKKILKERNGKRFLFYYLLLISTSLAMSLIYARLKERQEKIRQLEDELLSRLHNQNRELEEKNRAHLEAINSKNRFFSIIAHDLRNPFQVVLGYTGLLLENYENMSTSEIREYFQDIEQATGQLVRLLDNLLLWSRSQTGSLTMKAVRLDLQQLVSTTISLVQVNASRKKIELISLVPPHCFVEGDRDMVLTILRNIMTNAVKYTPEHGKVSVSILPTMDQKIQITVKDSGIGMSPGDLEKLFRTDITVTHKGTNGEGGTGLGLVLCAEFVEKHGGKIWAESEQGQGSEFHFTLPHHPDTMSK